jgi:hypothetical protein
MMMIMIMMIKYVGCEEVDWLEAAKDSAEFHDSVIKLLDLWVSLTCEFDYQRLN